MVGLRPPASAVLGQADMSNRAVSDMALHMCANGAACAITCVGGTDGAGELMRSVVQLVCAVRPDMAVHIRANGAARAITCVGGTDGAGKLMGLVMQLARAVHADMAVHMIANGAAGAITCMPTGLCT